MLILLLLEFGITIIKVTCRLRIALCYRKYKTKQKIKTGQQWLSSKRCIWKFPFIDEGGLSAPSLRYLVHCGKLY